METARNIELPTNGIDTEALRATIAEVERDPAKGIVAFRVNSAWEQQTLSRTSVSSYRLGGEKISRDFAITIDEPLELGGTNTAPNPQEVLMAALNACMLVGYACGASMRGIRLEKLEIETEGQLDLRGFLGIDPDVPAGYESIRYTVRIKGDGTPEQFREIHETVQATSPNYFNLSRPVRLDAVLAVER